MNNIEIQLTESNTFRTLADAVAAVKPDLSYNERTAWEKIRNYDKGCSFYTGTEKAVVNGDDIYTIYTTDDGLRIIKKFEPFISVLNNSPFQLVLMNDKAIQFTNSFAPKDSRAHLAAACKIGPEICFM